MKLLDRIGYFLIAAFYISYCIWHDEVFLGLSFLITFIFCGFIVGDYLCDYFISLTKKKRLCKKINDEKPLSVMLLDDIAIFGYIDDYTSIN